MENGQVLAQVRILGDLIDLPAPHAGVLEEILVSAAEHVPAGHALARLVVF